MYEFNWNLIIFAFMISIQARKRFSISISLAYNIYKYQDFLKRCLVNIEKQTHFLCSILRTFEKINSFYKCTTMQFMLWTCNSILWKSVINTGWSFSVVRNFYFKLHYDRKYNSNSLIYKMHKLSWKRYIFLNYNMIYDLEKSTKNIQYFHNRMINYLIILLIGCQTPLI